MAQDAQVYFVHSYHFKATDEADILATADYGEEIVSIVAKDNIIGTQFHPEKANSKAKHFYVDFWTGALKIKRALEELKFI